jgi:hypothetical protein
MTQDEFFDLVLDAEARDEVVGATRASRRAFTEERSDNALLQDELFQWIHELTL